MDVVVFMKCLSGVLEVHLWKEIWKKNLKEIFGLLANAASMRLNGSLDLQNLLSFLMFTTPLINADLYSCEEKRKILSGIYSQKSVDTMDDDMIENLFKEAMFKEIQRLEHDIQNFS